MVEREILKDVKDYDPKFIGPLTLRQFICAFIGCCITAAVFAFLYIPCNFQTMICVFVSGVSCTPAFACGWWKPYDIPLEKFAVSFFKMTVLSPSNRPYKVKNAFAEFETKPEVYTKKELDAMKKQRKIDEQELGKDYIPIN